MGDRQHPQSPFLSNWGYLHLVTHTQGAPAFPTPPPSQPWMRLMELGQLQQQGGGGRTTAGQKEALPPPGQRPRQSREEGERLKSPLHCLLGEERKRSASLRLPVPPEPLRARRCLRIPSRAGPLFSGLTDWQPWTSNPLHAASHIPQPSTQDRGPQPQQPLGHGHCTKQPKDPILSPAWQKAKRGSGSVDASLRVGRHSCIAHAAVTPVRLGTKSGTPLKHCAASCCMFLTYLHNEVDNIPGPVFGSRARVSHMLANQAAL